MEEAEGVLLYESTQMHYTVYGSGEKVILAFHGYGLTGKCFKPVAQELLEYTIYSFDLFYHGASFWEKGQEAITKEFWADMLEQFFKEKNIEKFSLMAFSMGGKFALATLEKYPHRLEELILIAPDGIKTNFWYSLATYPSFFRRIFRNMVANPTFYFNLVELLKRLKLVDKGVIRFSETQMQTREQRRRVFYSWTVFRKLSFDLNYLVALLNRYSVTLTVFLGRYDKIVEPHSILPFASRVTRNYIYILESGHTKLLVAVADWFRNR